MNGESPVKAGVSRRLSHKKSSSKSPVKRRRTERAKEVVHHKNTHSRAKAMNSIEPKGAGADSRKAKKPKVMQDVSNPPVAGQ